MERVVRPVFAVLYLVREFFRVVLCTHWFLNAACVSQTMAGTKARQDSNYTLNLVQREI